MKDAGRKDGGVLLCLWTDWEGVKAGGFRTSRYTNTSWYDSLKTQQVTPFKPMTMVSIPVSNLIPLLEFALRETLGFEMRTPKAKSPRSCCRTPAWLSVKLLINHSVLPWSHWITEHNLEAGVSNHYSVPPHESTIYPENCSIPPSKSTVNWHLVPARRGLTSKLC